MASTSLQDDLVLVPRYCFRTGNLGCGIMELFFFNPFSLFSLFYFILILLGSR